MLAVKVPAVRSRSHNIFIVRFTYLEAGVTCDTADNPMTTVQSCVSTFVSVKPLDIFKGDVLCTFFGSSFYFGLLLYVSLL